MPSKKLVLKFPKEVTDQPIVYKLIKDYDLVFNILKAQVSPEKEGLLVMELSGSEAAIEKGTKYLKENKVKIQPLERDINRDESVCTHCTACVVHCPTQALYIKDRDTMEVGFDKSKCILCEACIPICPVNAMKIDY
jgi:ferredoxin